MITKTSYKIKDNLLLKGLLIFLCSGYLNVAFSGSVTSAISPVIQFLLNEDSHLDRVLKEFENPDTDHIFIAAHRGGKEEDVADNAPGNSIANIDNAVSKEFDIYESDIEVLSDGTLIVFHDDVFDHLTNTTAISPDSLNDRDLAYAKSLFLTYENGQVSNEKIPTLEEFLTAGKGKIMFKFDLKSDTFSRIPEILETVVRTQTQSQVLIRGGTYLLDQTQDNNYDTKMIMPRLNDANTDADDINSLVAKYPIRAISLPNGAQPSALTAAQTHGLVVETHESQNPDPDVRLQSWQDAITKGYRQFHSFKPLKLKSYLDSINRHW